MNRLSQLTPQPLFNYFEDICQVPRPSKKEEKIRQFLLDFAVRNNLEAKTDEVGNVLILKPATSGMENAPTVILQTHMDMVCEKNSDKVFDFDNDPIETIVEDGWVKANGTTLGADCGIGIAAQMAVLTSTETSLPEVGGDAALYSHPGDISGISANMEIIVNDHDLRNMLREKGQIQQQKFSWDKTAIKVWECLESFTH